MRRGRRSTWLLVIGAVMVAIAFVRRSRSRRPADPDSAASRPLDALVDVASQDSFPASDPPSYWGRDPD